MGMLDFIVEQDPIVTEAFILSGKRRAERLGRNGVVVNS